MRLRTELAGGVLAFLTLDLLLVFAATGLFVRMGPAIERILTRNDATIAAAEDVLETLARAGSAGLAEAQRARVHAALARAHANVTEPGETEVLDGIDRVVAVALDGDKAARTVLLDRVRELIAINRTAMRQADLDAQRLGTAGAWAASFVGLATVAFGLFLTRTLDRRVVRPIAEIGETLRAAREGNRFRRCSTRGAAHELRSAMESVNHILDRVGPAPEEGLTDAVVREP